MTRTLSAPVLVALCKQPQKELMEGSLDHEKFHVYQFLLSSNEDRIRKVPITSPLLFHLSQCRPSFHQVSN